MDENGYPTEETLERIRTWDPRDGTGLMHAIADLWYCACCCKWVDGTLSCSTGGWSGNEDLIDAMRDNVAWWALHWLSSRRGGHYEFRDYGLR